MRETTGLNTRGKKRKVMGQDEAERGEREEQTSCFLSRVIGHLESFKMINTEITTQNNAIICNTKKEKNLLFCLVNYIHSLSYTFELYEPEDRLRIHDEQSSKSSVIVLYHHRLLPDAVPT